MKCIIVSTIELRGPFSEGSELIHLVFWLHTVGLSNWR